VDPADLSLALLSANSLSMNPRHAAALALVGWYLMVPPGSMEGGFGDAKAPLSRWQIAFSFEDAGVCEAVRNRMMEKIRNKWATELRDPKDPKIDAAVNQKTVDEMAKFTGMNDWVCIATDDPRLKEK
jgi:hypothetical protein